MSWSNYLRVWLACARYSVVRTMMFRFDFLMWSLVELFWMTVNLVLINVIYDHTHDVAGWTKYQMLLLVGTSMIIQRLLMGFFWSNLMEMGRNIRTGTFDFFLAQPGNPLFMVATRKLDLDSLSNVFVAVGVVVYSVHKLAMHPGIGDILGYTALLFCGLAVNFGALLIIVSLTFWITSSQGIEGSYFTLFEFARLPREAFRGAANVIFVWTLPVIVVTNVPARTLLGTVTASEVLWLLGTSLAWAALGVLVFNRGLRRYASASS